MYMERSLKYLLKVEGIEGVKAQGSATGWMAKVMEHMI